LQIIDRIDYCTGCEACVVGCKFNCVKMITDEQGFKRPVIDENGCDRCNNCLLYCPVYNPVELPKFEDYYTGDDAFYERNMAAVYRRTMRSLKSGTTTEFAGTLCQIAALKSLMGDKLSHDLRLKPLACDPDDPKRPECAQCTFYHSMEK